MSVQRGRLAGREAESPPRAGHRRADRRSSPGGAVPGVEEVVDGVYRRSLADGSVLALTPDGEVERGRRCRARDPAARRRPGRRSRRGWAAIRCSARSSRAAPGRPRPRPPGPGRAGRARRCSASRSRSPPRARSPGRLTAAAGRAAGRAAAAASPTASRRPPRWRRSTRRRCRCRAPAAARSCAWPPRWPTGEPVGRSACPGSGRGRPPTSRCAQATTTRSCPTDLGVKHGLAGAGRRPGAGGGAGRGVAALPGLRRRLWAAAAGGSEGGPRWRYRKVVGVYRKGGGSRKLGNYSACVLGRTGAGDST